MTMPEQLPRVPYDSLEFTTTDYVDVLYQGQLFTGIAYEDEPGEYSEAHYLLGSPHGIWYSHTDAGQPTSFRLYRNGAPIGTHFAWSRKGVLTSIRKYVDGKLQEEKLWTSEGVPIK